MFTFASRQCANDFHPHGCLLVLTNRKGTHQAMVFGERRVQQPFGALTVVGLALQPSWQASPSWRPSWAHRPPLHPPL